MTESCRSPARFGPFTDQALGHLGKANPVKHVIVVKHVGQNIDEHAGRDIWYHEALRDADGTPIGILFAMWRSPLTLREDLQAMVSIFASRANAELVRLRRDREILRLNSSLEERVRERTAELGKLNAELDSFAYSVSHDLKSPLRAIDGFTQLLREQLAGRLSEDEQQLFERVLGSSQRMGAIINDLLALARVSQGVLERQAVDLVEDLAVGPAVVLVVRPCRWPPSAPWPIRCPR